MAAMYAHVSAPPPRASHVNPELPPAVDAVLARALSKAPRDRHESAGAFVEDLGAALGLLRIPAARQESASKPVGTSGERAGPVHGTARAVEALDQTLCVGREDLLDALRARWRESGAMGKRMVFLLGEAGVGKTRLAARFAAECARDGARVLYGRCDDEIHLPYQPFAEALREFLRQDDAPRAGGDLDPELEELSRLIPDARRRLRLPRPNPQGEGEDDTGRFLLFEAVASVLASATASRRLVLILDDLHWADRPTWLLLRHVLRHSDVHSLTVIATYRGVDARPGSPVLRLQAALPTNVPCERISVSGLDIHATAALVAARLDRPVSDDFLRALRRQTDGNPFFMEEALRSLPKRTAAGDDGRLDDTALARMGVPDGIAEVILRRLEQLSGDARPVLNAAAAIGQEFDVPLLEAILSIPADTVLAALDDAIREGLVVEVPGRLDHFAFAHALIREAIYGSQTLSRRLRLHSRLGQALETLEGGENRVAELAHHFYLARELTGPERAIRYARAAAEQAIASRAYEEAEVQFRRVLEALDMNSGADPDERGALLLSLGRVQWQAGSARARATFLEAADDARRRKAPEQLASAALGLGERYWEANIVDEEFGRLLAEALTALPADARYLRSRLLARLAQNLHFSGDTDRADAVSGEALALAREIGDHRALLIALLGRHVALLHVAHVDERLPLTDEILRLAPADSPIAAEARHWRVYDLLESGRLDDAHDEQRTLERLTERLHLPLFEFFSMVWKALWAQIGGQLDEATRIAQAGYDVGRRARVQDASSVVSAVFFTVWREQGRSAELVGRIESLPRGHAALPVWQAALTLARLDAGDVHGARQRHDRMAAAGFPVPEDLFWLSTTAMLAEACSVFRDADGAVVLYERLLPHAGRLVQVSCAACWGSVERYLSQLALVMGDTDRAVAHGDAAVEGNLALDAPLLAARARCTYAAALRARARTGDAELANRHARAALEAAMALGSEQLENLAATLLEPGTSTPIEGHEQSSPDPIPGGSPTAPSRRE